MAALCLALIAPACGGEERRTRGGGRVVSVLVDAKTNRFNATFLAYFPSSVTIRPGDAVEFRPQWTGEPHGVAFGTLVEAALTSPDALAKVPLGKLVWPGNLPPASAQPCYLETGAPPEDGISACPTTARPLLTGRHAYHSSGFIPEDETYTVEVAKDAAPGTYRFFCPFHGPRMAGSLVVSARGDAPEQGAIDDAAREQRGELVDAVLPNLERTYAPYKRARAGDFPFPAQAGFAGVPVVSVNEFAPFTIKAKQNERVTWVVHGRHVISFGAPSNSGPPAVIKLENDRVQFVRESLENVKSPDPPREAPAAPVVVDGGRYNRDRGTHSSGLLVGDDTGTLVYSIRFTRPATYRYKCLVHPRMGGLVTVTL